MGWLRKGLLLLPCAGHDRPQNVRQQQECSSLTPWHQQTDIVSLVLARLSTADVLSSERVCKAWRRSRVLLTSDVQFVIGKKVFRWQHAWLTRNVDRIASRLVLVEEDTAAHSKASTFRGHPAGKHADVVLLALKSSQTRNLELQKCSSITTLPADSFAALHRLQQLTISDCHNLIALPQSLSALISMTHLRISSCSRLGALPNSIDQLTALQQLVIEACVQLQHVPSSIGRLSRLKQLTLHICPLLQQLPDSMGELSSLLQLDIALCCFKAVPSGIGKLSLQDLRIVQCPHIQELPESFSQLQQLQKLDLQLHLRYLPSISQLSSLKHLKIASIREETTSFTHHIGQLGNLESLTLVGWVGLQELPEGLGDLARLTQLGFRDCGQLMGLPSSLGRLSSLRRLILQGCGLISLPQTLGQLKSLKSLIIHSCEIRDLPNSIGQLTALQQFVLVDCPRLRHIPGTFGHLGRQVQQQQGLRPCNLQRQISSGDSRRDEECSSNIGSGGGDSSKMTLTISGCDNLQLPVSMGHLRRFITPGHLAAVTAEQAMQASW